VSERAGVINIALEGMMMVGAFAAAVVAEKFQTSAMAPELGALSGILAGVTLAAVYGLAVIRLRADQIVAGTAVNMLALGITPFLCKILYGVSGATPALGLASRFEYAPMFWAFVVVLLLHFWIKFSPSGVWVRFAGEKPDALDAAGVSVNRVRWFATLVGGGLAGLGGASLSIYLASSFSRNMTAGRGFMALAALIFGNWEPIPAAVACLFFGFADALQTKLQGIVIWGSDPVPVEFIQMLPYVVTVLVLAGFVGKSRAPKALGLPFGSV